MYYYMIGVFLFDVFLVILKLKNTRHEILTKRS